MTDIIKNGSFEEGTVYGKHGQYERYEPTDWFLPYDNDDFVYITKEHPDAEMCDTDGDNTTALRFGPTSRSDGYNFETAEYLARCSVGQVIDLTGYEGSLVLNIDFYYGSNYLEYENTSFCVYLYKVDSFNKETGEFTCDKAFSDYLKKDTYVCAEKEYEEVKQGVNTIIEYDPYMDWRKGSFVAVGLKPGHYLLLFAPSEGYTLDKVSGSVVEVVEQVVPYHNVIKNGSFESHVNSEFYYWHYDGIRIAPDGVDHYGNVNNLLGSYVCLERSEDYLTVDESIVNKYGLKQIFNVDSYCQMEIAFLFKQHESYPMALSIYKVTSYISDSNYTIDDAPYFQAYIEASQPAEDGYSEWNEFSRIVGVEPSRYLLVIHPSKYTGVIDNVKINLFTGQDTDHDGSFENPYTSDDGRFSPAMYRFLPFNSDIDGESLVGFIYYEGEYYYSKSRYGSLALNTILNDRYYYPDGRMARSESFIYNKKLYTADVFGYITHETNAILDMVPYYGDDMLIGPVRSFDILVETTDHIYVYFMTQTSEVALNVTSSDSNIVFCSGIGPGLDNNQIALTGRNPGVATVTISYTNLDGSTVSRDIKVSVFPKTSEYIDITALYLLRDEVGILPGESLQLEYEIIPEADMDLALDWSSTNETIATVDNNGVVTGKKTGRCEIIIYNYRLDIGYYCDLYVLEQTETPVNIETSRYQTTVKVGEQAHLPHYELIDYNGNSYTVRQDGYWTSDDPSIASINDYGMIVGNSIGSTIIRCKTPQNPKIAEKHIVKVVASEAPITDIELDVYEATLNDTSIHGYLKINYKVVPADTNQTEVVWSSSNPDLVSVTSNGLVSLRKTVTSVQTVSVICTSVANPSVFRTCTITLDPSVRYPYKIKSFNKENQAIINQNVTIEYEVDNCFSHSVWDKFDYDVTVSMADGSTASSSRYTITHEKGVSIDFSASAEGNYKITLLCKYTPNGIPDTYTYGEEYFYVNVEKESTDLAFVKSLESLFGLSNGSYILRCFVRNNSDGALNFELNTGSGWNGVIVDNLMYQGQMYNYIFGNNLSAGTYTAQVRVTDANGKSNTSNTVTLTIPAITSDKKSALEVAKSHYEVVEKDIVDYLHAVIVDNKVYKNEGLEFDTRYKMYCYLYYNLKNMLEICISHINSQVGAAQAEMAVLSDTLSSDGVSVATYAEDDSTNANYKNTTNMDYYQNECIKKLVARVFELEARLDELTNNNN